MALPQQWNYSVAQASLAPPAKVPERYAELWWYSGSANGNTSTTSGTTFLQKGGGPSNVNTTPWKLYTLNASWPASTKFAFEIALWVSSGQTAYAALYDTNTSSIVSASQVSITSTTATVMRSGQFTLTPGHTYAVTVWTTTSGTVYECDASLIIFS